MSSSCPNQIALRSFWPAASLRESLAGKFVAKSILPIKNFRLSYLTTTLPLLVFAVLRRQGSVCLINYSQNTNNDNCKSKHAQTLCRLLFNTGKVAVCLELKTLALAKCKEMPAIEMHERKLTIFHEA